MNQQVLNPADASPVEPTAAMTGVEMKGFFIASTVATLPEFRALGESVLMAQGITSLDPQAYYPGTLRRLVHSAIYDRFGAEAIFWLGIENWKFFSSSGLFKFGAATPESALCALTDDDLNLRAPRPVSAWEGTGPDCGWPGRARGTIPGSFPDTTWPPL
jgi:hypothetical protein